MSILDTLKSMIGSKVKHEINKAVNNTVQNVGKEIGKGRNHTETFSFNSIPASVEELKALPEAKLDTAFKTTALVMIVLAKFETDPEATYAMLDHLKGPESFTTPEKAFLKERLNGKAYKIRSYFKGATPENNYTPTMPYTVDIIENPYSFDNENWATLWVKSSGADNERQIKLRRKPSTGEWFLNDIQCLSDVRPPVSENPWA